MVLVVVVVVVDAVVAEKDADHDDPARCRDLRRRRAHQQRANLPI